MTARVDRVRSSAYYRELRQEYGRGVQDAFREVLRHWYFVAELRRTVKAAEKRSKAAKKAWRVRKAKARAAS